MNNTGISHTPIYLACAVIVIAGIHYAADIVSIGMLSFFLAIASLPALYAMQKIKIPNLLAVGIIVSGLGALGLVAATIVGSSVADFSNNLPGYQANLENQFAVFLDWIGSFGIDVQADKIKEVVKPGAVMGVAGSVVVVFGNILTEMFVIILIVVFILLEVHDFPKKWLTVESNAP